MNTSIAVAFISLFLLPIGFEPAHTSRTLDASAAPEARPYFEKGLLLLHNFEYVDAAEQFKLAQEKDPSFVLSYWGEAMTYDHPIWRSQNIEKSRAALARLAATPEERKMKAKTSLERDLMGGAEILFGDGSKADREKAYSKYMSGLYSKYPDNSDVAAFYALSLLAIKKGWTEWEEYNVQAAEITQRLLARDPDHPGALHYLVHANDHPRYAGRGLNAADRYAEVASYAGHALHMPSHIYLALGMWDDVVRSNEVSWQAGIDRKEKKALNNDALNYHAHWWLAYGYLQQGRFNKAKERVDAQVKYATELPSSPALFHLLEMKGQYLFTTNDWTGPIAAIQVDENKLNAGDKHLYNFIEGYKLFKLKKATELSDLIERFDENVARVAQLQKASKDVSVCGTAYVPTDIEVKASQRYLRELKGLHAWMERDMPSAEAFFKEALPAEGSVVVGPPVFLISPYELYGHFLLENDRPREALQQFEKALAASPNRYIALKGKLSAARALKDTGVEKSTLKQLQENLKDADPEARAELL